MGSDELIGIGQTLRAIHSPVTVDLRLTQRVSDGRITRGHMGRTTGEPKLGRTEANHYGTVPGVMNWIGVDPDYSTLGSSSRCLITIGRSLPCMIGPTRGCCSGSRPKVEGPPVSRSAKVAHHSHESQIGMPAGAK